LAAAINKLQETLNNLPNNTHKDDPDVQAQWNSYPPKRTVSKIRETTIEFVLSKSCFVSKTSFFPQSCHSFKNELNFWPLASSTTGGLQPQMSPTQAFPELWPTLLIFFARQQTENEELLHNHIDFWVDPFGDPVQYQDPVPRTTDATPGSSR